MRLLGQISVRSFYLETNSLTRMILKQQNQQNYFDKHNTIITKCITKILFDNAVPNAGKLYALVFATMSKMFVPRGMHTFHETFINEQQPETPLCKISVFFVIYKKSLKALMSQKLIRLNACKEFANKTAYTLCIRC